MTKAKGLAALKAAGALLGEEPRKVEISWKNDAGEQHEFDMWIRPMSFGAALELREDSSPNKIASALASLVLLEDEEGNRVPLGYDTARGLHPGLGWEILKAINGTAAKNSLPPTS